MYPKNGDAFNLLTPKLFTKLVPNVELVLPL